MSEERRIWFLSRVQIQGDALHLARTVLDEGAVVGANAIVAYLDGLHGPSEVWRHVSDKRFQQDAQWGGPAHDDHHIPSDWIEFIVRQMSQATGANHAVPPDLAAVRDRLIDVAALAIAAAESLDRKRKKRSDTEHFDGGRLG